MKDVDAVITAKTLKELLDTLPAPISIPGLIRCGSLAWLTMCDLYAASGRVLSSGQDLLIGLPIECAPYLEPTRVEILSVAGTVLKSFDLMPNS